MTNPAQVYDAADSAFAAVQTASGAYLALNEAETRAHLVDPIVRALGYLTLDEVRREYRLEASGQFVDYLLLAGDTRVVIEAKPAGSELSAKDASQLVGYCAQEGIRWALLTNGLRWAIFDVQLIGNWERKRVAIIDLWSARNAGSLATSLVPLQLFARSVLTSTDQDLQAWSRGERARAYFDHLVSNAESPVVQLLVHAMANEGIDLDPSEAVQLLQRGSLPRPQDVVPEVAPPPTAATTSGRRNVVFPVGDAGGFTAVDHLKAWLTSSRWGVGGSTANRKKLKAGDRCCFYIPKAGIVARGEIASPADREVRPTEWPGPNPYTPGVYEVPLASVHWIQPTVTLDAQLRARLDAFQGRDPTKPWGWLVQTTNQLSDRDFDLMTGQTS